MWKKVSELPSWPCRLGKESSPADVDVEFLLTAGEFEIQWRWKAESAAGRIQNPLDVGGGFYTLSGNGKPRHGVEKKHAFHLQCTRMSDTLKKSKLSASAPLCLTWSKNRHCCLKQRFIMQGALLNFFAIVLWRSWLRRKLINESSQKWAFIPFLKDACLHH